MSEHAPKRRGPMGGHGPMGGMHMAGEKAKDFKGSFKKLLKYLGKYRVAIVIVMIFAIASAAFMVLGPKILGKAITEMMNGLIAKVTGVEGGGINGSAKSCCLCWGCMSSAPPSPLSRVSS